MCTGLTAAPILFGKTRVVALSFAILSGLWLTAYKHNIICKSEAHMEGEQPPEWKEASNPWQFVRFSTGS